jgi:hypothetical protein
MAVGSIFSNTAIGPDLKHAAVQDFSPVLK